MRCKEFILSSFFELKVIIWKCVVKFYIPILIFKISHSSIKICRYYVQFFIRTVQYQQTIMEWKETFNL